MSTAVIGPVIGKVTETTARFLIELDANRDVTCIAKSRSTPHERRVEASLPKKACRAIAFADLQPGETYDITISGVRHPNASFRTLPVAASRMNIGAVSCNHGRLGKRDLWQDMHDRYVEPGQLDLLLHLGDQIYADDVFARCLYELGARDRPTQAQQRRFLEYYRELYRRNWSHPPTRDVLANVPNLMIWDDHELTDDWGSEPSHRDPDSREFQIGLIARRAYREYQRQLWTDVADGQPEDGFEDHHHRFGNIGVVFVDQRGGRSFQTDTTYPYLGGPQWQRLHETLGPGGELDECKALIVVTSVPLIYLGDGISGMATAIEDDIRDHWSFGTHVTEQTLMLRVLRGWVERKPGRDLLVVGGDVHLGGHTTIEHGGEPIFQQMITSPIANTPPNWFQTLALNTLLESEEAVQGNYSFEHGWFTNKRNYGIVVARATDDRPAQVTGSLVTQ